MPAGGETIHHTRARRRGAFRAALSRETYWRGARGKGPRQKQRGAVQPADVLPWKSVHRYDYVRVEKEGRSGTQSCSL